ncbi:hypothetical protein [Shimia sp. NS0008-38b]|uniref:hypothetical protein n=1 Tax=Shimia sp. NS0008-38b TaxID=3127653 RepID=UPI00333E1EDB
MRFGASRALLLHLLFDEANQQRVAHHDNHELDKIVGWPPMLPIGALQFEDAMGFSSSQAFLGPDITNNADRRRKRIRLDLERPAVPACLPHLANTG